MLESSAESLDAAISSSRETLPSLFVSKTSKILFAVSVECFLLHPSLRRLGRPEVVPEDVTSPFCQKSVIFILTDEAITVGVDLLISAAAPFPLPPFDIAACNSVRSMLPSPFVSSFVNILYAVRRAPAL